MAINRKPDPNVKRPAPPPAPPRLSESALQELRVKPGLCFPKSEAKQADNFIPGLIVGRIIGGVIGGCCQ